MHITNSLVLIYEKYAAYAMGGLSVVSDQFWCRLALRPCLLDSIWSRSLCVYSRSLSFAQLKSWCVPTKKLPWVSAVPPRFFGVSIQLFCIFLITTLTIWQVLNRFNSNYWLWCLIIICSLHQHYVKEQK